MASMKCMCGDVVIRFATQKPVHSWECCCVDCYAKNIHALKRTGEAMPQHISEIHGEGKPLALYYYPNRITIVNGREKIAFTKIRERASSTNMIADCCGALMCVDNPGYAGQMVLIFPEFRPLEGAGDLDEPEVRVFIGDFPADRLDALPHKPGWNREADGSSREYPTGDVKALAARKRFKGLASKEICPVLSSSSGERFADLLNAAGGFTNLDLPELSNSATLRRARQRTPN